MSPVTNKANLHVDPKRTNDNETDEGFVSPSVQRIGVNRKINSESSDNNSDTASDNGSQTETSSSSSSSSSSGSQGLGSLPSDDERPTSNKKSSDAEESNSNGASNVNKPNTSKDAVESKAESLAKFIVYTLLGNISGNTNDKVERTLLRCVKLIMQKHEILFKGMMKRLQLTRETGYSDFVTIANTLFEDEKQIITWSRIITLYAFGGQLALYFKEKNMEDLSLTVAHLWIGKYTKENLTTHIMSIGGWGKICEEFPEDSDIENKIKRVLSWTAVGLGVAATLFHLTSR